MLIRIVSKKKELYTFHHIKTTKGNEVKFANGAFLFELDEENYQKLKNDKFTSALIEKKVIEISEITDEKAEEKETKKKVEAINTEDLQIKAIQEELGKVEAELLECENREAVIASEYGVKYLSQASKEGNKIKKNLIKEITDAMFAEKKAALGIE